jgi:hypothetical protein
VITFGFGLIERQLDLYKVMRMDTHDGMRGLINTGTREPVLAFLSIEGWSEKVAVCKPGRKLSPEINHIDTQVSVF